MFLNALDWKGDGKMRRGETVREVGREGEGRGRIGSDKVERK